MIAAWLAASLAITAATTSDVHERRLRVYVAVVRDDSRQASVGAVRINLEQALRAHPRATLVPRKLWLKAVQETMVPPDRWLEGWALKRLTRDMNLDAVIAVRLIRKGRQDFRLAMRALDPKSGAELAEASVTLAQPVMPKGKAELLADTLISQLLKTEPVAALPTEQATEEKPSAEPTEPPPPDTVDTRAAEQAPPITTEVGAANGAAWGEDLTFDEIAEDEVLARVPLELGGRIEVEHFSYFDDLGPEKNAGRNSVDFSLEAKTGARQASAVGAILVRRDFSDPARNRIEVERAYVEVNTERLSFRGGQMINAWGTANLYNPTDILNPVDMRDPIEVEKLPTLTFRLGLLLDPVLIDFYFLPVPEAHRIALPETIATDGTLRGRSRWIEGRLGEPSPLPLYFTLAGEPPPPSPASSQAAARLSVSAGGIDASLGYAYLIDRLPTFETTVTLDPQPIPTFADVAVDLRYLRLHAVTMDAETTLGKLRLATEAVGVLTEDPNDEDDAIDNPWVTAVLAIDYRTSQFLEDHSVHFFLDLTTTQPLAGELPTGLFGRMRHPFRTAALGRVTYEAGADAAVSLNAITSLTAYDVLLNPQLELSFHEKVTLRAGVQVLMGEKDKGLFGRFPENSRVVIELESSL